MSNASPPLPPLDGLRKQLEKARLKKSRMQRDGFIRETFTLPREVARAKAREWFTTYPRAAYWTEIESWCERPDDVIEFTMKRLPSSD